MENTASQIEESEQRAAKRLKVDDSAQPAELPAAEEQRAAVDEAYKQVEPVPVSGNAGEKADAQMSDAPAMETKPADDGPGAVHTGDAPAQPKKDDRDVRRGQAPIKAE